VRPLLTRRLAVGLLLFIVSGCAQRTDWVEGTLVTVDVTGVWKGRVTPSVAIGGLSGEFEMTLAQRGPKVTGDGRIRAQQLSIEGTVRGDVFSFSDLEGRLRGQATVIGDQMSGEARTNMASSRRDRRLEGTNDAPAQWDGRRVRGDTRTARSAGDRRRPDPRAQDQHRGNLRAEATVTGDEMSRAGWSPDSSTYGDFNIRLARQPQNAKRTRLEIA
jgi:hypothetical protein